MESILLFAGPGVKSRIAKSCGEHVMNHTHNAGCGENFCFHGAYREKADAQAKEKATPGAFIKLLPYPPYSIQDQRYTVLTRRQESGVRSQNPEKYAVICSNRVEAKGLTLKDARRILALKIEQEPDRDWAIVPEKDAQENPLLSPAEKRLIRLKAKRGIKRLLGFGPRAKKPGNRQQATGYSRTDKAKIHRSPQRSVAQDEVLDALERQGYSRSRAKELVGKHARGGDTAEMIFDRIFKKNPDLSAADQKALDFYRGFHGHDPDEVIEMEATIIESGKYVSLGKLFGYDLEAFPVASMRRLKDYDDSFIDPQTGLRSPNFLTIHRNIKLCGGEFEKKGALWVCHQLVILDGNQDLEKYIEREFDIHSSTRLVDLGPIVNIWYQAQKSRDPEPRYYHHTFGEEEKGAKAKSAARPRLMYDRKHRKQHIVGGNYSVPIEGIRN